MGRTNTNYANTYDAWSKIAKTRYHAAKLREKAIDAECTGNEAIATKFMSLADVIDARCDREQLNITMGVR
jgi:hypothetical protein